MVTPSGTGAIVSHTTGADTVHSLTANSSLLISGGSVTVTGDLSGVVSETTGGQLTVSGTGSTVGNVTLDVSGGGVVNLSGTLDNTGNTLTITGNGTVNLSGTLIGGTLDLASGAQLTTNSGTLDGVTLNGAVTITGDEYANVENGLTVNGTLTLGDSTTNNGGYLRFEGSQTLDGSGSIVFGSNSNYNALDVTQAGTTLTIGSDLTIHGQTGYIGYDPTLGGSASVTVDNQGTIDADTSGGTISLYEETIQGNGTYENANGGVLSMAYSTLDAVTLNNANALSLVGATLDGVTIDGNWQVVGDNSVTVTDGLTLNGTLSLGDASSIGYLNFSGTQTLGGNGAVVFGSTTYNSYYAYYNGLFVTTSGTTLTIGPDVTIRGKLGAIGYDFPEGSSNGSIDNEGTIQADVAGGTITINGTNNQNTGTLNALNGGTLNLQGSGWQDNGVNYADSTSTFVLNGSFSNSGNTMALTGPGAFSVSGGSIQGGILNVAAGTLLNVTSGTLDGLTIDGNWQVVGDNSVTVTDGLTLNGTLSLGDASSIGYLNFSGTQTLGGNGAVVFGSTTYNSYYAYYNGLFVTTSGTTLTIGPDVTIRGNRGVIGYAYPYEGSLSGSIDNQGTIQADVSGGSITIDGTGCQNTGTLNALNGGNLSLQGSGWLDSGINYADATSTFTLGASFTNSGNTLALTGAGTFNAPGATIQGGTISVASGTLLNAASGTLDGVTIDGNWQVVGNNSVTVEDGLTLNGTLSLGDASSIGYLNFSGTQTLAGTGTVVFGSATYSPYYTYYNGLFVTTSATTLTIGPDVTIRGNRGVIGYAYPYEGSLSGSIDNQGTIQADVSGGSITIDGTGCQNTGTLNALNGGNLSLQGSGWLDSGINYADATSTFTLGASFTNSGNTLALTGAGTFTANGTIQGGTLDVASGTTLNLNGAIDGLTINGNWQVVGDNSVTVEDGLTLNGTLSLGDTSSVGYLNFSGTQTLAGTGVVVFGSATYSPYYTYYNGLFVTTSETTLTIGPNITVRGNLGAIGYVYPYEGSSSGSIVNQGTIQADVAGGSISINGTNDQNSGSLNALNGGTLSIQGTLTNTATVSVEATSVLSLSETLSGGIIATEAGAQIRGGTLDGVTIDGNWQVVGNNSVTVEDGLTLNGTLSLGDASSIGYLNFSGTQTLAGTGTVAFGSTTYSPYYTYYNGLFVTTSGTTLTIGPDVTIRGNRGVIGYAYPYEGSLSGSIDNQGTIQADVSGGSITINGSGGVFTNTGTVNASAGSISISTGSFGTVNSGTLSVGPTGTLDISGPYTQSATGNFNVVLGGSATNLYGHAAISGTASLDGTLNISEANNFSPNTGNIFTILTYSSATGQFASYTGLLLSGTSALQPAYNPGSTTLTTVTNTTVAPDLRVINLALSPANPQSSQNVTVNWTDFNAGNGSTGASWTDRVVVTNTTTGQTIATADVPYNAAVNGNLAPNGSANLSYTFRMPDGTAGVGNLLVSVTTDYYNTIPEYYPGNVGETNNTTTITASSTLASYPDLQVSGLTYAPSNPQSGQNLSILWNDINTGQGDTSGNWTDQVTVVNTTTGQTLVNTEVPYNAANSGNIAAGGASPHLSYTFQLPEGLSGVGSLQISVTTNATGELYEYNSGGTANSNNTATVTATSTLADYADLTVTNVALQSPASPQSGNQVTVGWDDKNIGNAAVNAPFNDSALVQRVNSDNTLTTIAAGTVSGNGSLAAGATSAQTFTFTLPDGAAGVGNFLVTVTTDSGQAVTEYDSSGNPAYGNNTNTGTFATSLANYADLTVSNVAVQSPTSPQSGNLVTVGWDDENVGDAAVSSPFNDSVLVQKVNSDNSLTTIASGNVSGNSSLAAGASSNQTFSFTLPDGAAGTGSFLITVTTDSGQTVMEYDSNGNPAFGNNTSTASFTSTLANYADLTVTNVALQSPSSPQSGNQVTVGWDDDNVGNADVNAPFNDSVLVQRVNSDNTLTTIASGNVSGNSSLAVGATSAQTFTFTLPDGAAGVGNFLVTVTTDSGQTVIEHDSSGNPAYGNNTATTNFSSSLAAYPDLQVQNLSTVPASPQSGGTLTITWDDANTGDAAVTSAFNDRVVVDNLTTGQPLVDTLLPYDPTAAGNAAIGARLSIPRQYSFTLPDGTVGTGQLQITVETNALDQFFEYNASGTGQSNNSATVTVTSVLASYPDLAVSNVTAAASAVPGQQINVSWTLSNVGSATASGPWTEQVLLADDSAGDNATLLATQTNSGPLAAGQSVPRSVSLQVPSLIAGNYWLVVNENPSGQVFELNTTNDTAVASQPTNIAVALSLAPAAVTIAQNANPASLAVTLARTGDTSTDLTVNLSSDDPTDLSVPDMVTIPAGQSTVTFNATVHDSGVAVANQLVHLTASVPGAVSGSAAVTVLDTDQPALLVAVPSQLTEGQSGSFTVTRGGDLSNAETVNLAVSLPSQITVPATVVIPAGQSSVTATMTSIDDGLPEKPQNVTVNAAGPGLAPASATMQFLSNNIPTLSLTPSAANVLESATATGIQLVVQRQKVTIGPLTVKLFLSDTTLGTVPATVVIPANAASTSFTFLPIDDHLADGPHTETITAYGAYASCGCTILTGSAASTIMIVNDNEPSLELALSKTLIFKDDTNPAAMGTVSRPDSDTSNPLVVTLTSGDTTEATVPDSVTIPAGQVSASFPIDAVPDGSEHGNQSITLSAGADGFASATASLTVTDIELPQLVVTQIEPSSSTVATDNQFSVSFTITNQGRAPATGTWQQQLYLSDNAQGSDATLVGTYSLTATLNPGDSFSRTVPVTAPDAPGNYWMVVADDVDNQITQVSGGDNLVVSPQSVQVMPEYTATVATSVSVAPAGTSVLFTGTATIVSTDAPAQYKLVDVHVDVNGIDRVVSALTDASGNFSATFTPLPSEAGVYTFFAAHPHVATGRPQGEFSLVGFTANPSEPSVTLIPGAAAVTGQITLNNLGDVALTGVSAVVSANPQGLAGSLSLGDGSAGQTLAANGSLILSYTLSAAAGAAAGPATVTVHVSTNEGATLDIPIDVTVKPLTPLLTTNPGSLYSGMVLGSQTLVSFTVSNDGGAATGPLAVLLPQNAPWLQLSGPATLSSLQPGDTQTITLQLTPDTSLALANYSGAIDVQGTSAGAAISVPFTFQAVSNAVGDLSIDAQDEYTYFASGAPHVAGAQVTATNVVTGAVTTGVTGSDGTLLLSSLPVGYYSVSVTATGHDTYNGTALIGAAATTSVVAFLPRQTVTESWTVTPTQIQDQTQVSLNVTFATDVPLPVVTVTPGSIDLSSLTAVGQTMTVQLTLTNHGLIAAQKVTLNFPSHPFYTFTPLVSELDSLPAESSLTIPLVITKVGGLGIGGGTGGGDNGGNNGGGNNGNGGNSGGDNGSQPDCEQLGAGTVQYQYVCGPDNVLRQVPIYFQNASDPCATPPIPIAPPPITGPRPPISQPGGPSGGGPGGGTSGPGGGPGGGSSGPGGVVGSDPPPPVGGNSCTPPSANCPPTNCITVGLDDTNGVVHELTSALQNVPLLSNIEVSVDGEGEVCYANSVEVSESGEIGGSVTGDIPITGVEIKKSFSALGYTASITLTVSPLDVTGELQAGGSGEWSTDCDGNKHSKFGVDVSGTIGLQAKAEIEGELKTPSGADYKAGVDATAGIYGDVSYEYASEDGEAPTWSGEYTLRLSASGTLTLGGYSFNLSYNDILAQDPAGNSTSPPSGDPPAGDPPASDPPAEDTVTAPDGSTESTAATDVVEAGVGNLFGSGPGPVNLTGDDIWEGVPQAAVAQALGYTSVGQMTQDLGVAVPSRPLTLATATAISQAYGAIHNNNGATVCAQVELQINQNLVLTRDAFIGTLQLGDQEPSPLQDVQVQLHVYDTSGNDQTSLFTIEPPTLTGLTAVDGTGALAGNTTGSASWTIVPSDQAAPTQATDYTVGGVIEYVDNGVPVTINLTPAPITVMPQPALDVNYFLQRDVYGEDPTRPGTEPIIPFVLGVIVTNTGGGTATNLSIDSAQPQIVDNQKGLLDNFQIIATQVNGNSLMPSLQANFGDLGSGQTDVAEWLLTSTLQGQFINYQATFADTSGLNDPDVSIVKNVMIHSMVHAVDAYGTYEDGKPDFLVDDNPNTQDQPDTLYLSDGTTAPVDDFSSPTFSGSPTPGNLAVQLTMPAATGWNYLDAPDPGNGQYTLVKVVRSDGVVLPAADYWQTDRNFVGIGQEPIYVNELHLFDYDSTGSYTLYYAPVDHTPPTSTVATLQPFSPAQFNVSWSGSDNAGGSGLASYSVFVSDDGGPFVPWMLNTTQTSATFSGQNGHSYSFYSIATDSVGNIQPTPPGAQASTTVDTVAPASSVSALPAFSPASFTVSWSGTDNSGGSGIASYSIFVSDDGGTFTPLLTDTTLTSTTFTGVNGHSYGFYSVATDNVGNEETAPTMAEATTTVDAIAPTSTVAALPAFSPGAFTVNWSGSDNSDGSGMANYTVYVSDNGGAFTPLLSNTTLTSTTFTGVNAHTYAFYSVAADTVGNVQATPTSAQASTTVDATPPTSSVSALPLFSPGSFTIKWSGSDGNGSGIADYNIYVSDNGGAFTPLLIDTTQTSTTFTGINGHTYGFYSVATDNAGNIQPTPSSAQASTTVDTVPPTSSVQALPAFSPATFTVSWSGSDGSGSGIANYSVYVSDNGGAFTLLVGSTTMTSTTFTGQNGHTYGFYSIATDNVGNTQPTPTAAQATTTVSAASLSVVSTATLSALQGETTGSVLLARFTQGSATQLAGAYTATVVWGDGHSDTSTEASSPISLQVSGQTISVYGTHTYTTAGTQNLSVTVSTAGTSATAYPTVTVSPNVSHQISSKASGLVYNRATQLFGGTITLTNTGTTNLTGTLMVELTGLPSGVTLNNASGTAPDGNLYILVSLPNGILAPGKSVTFNVYFRNPNRVSFSYGLTTFDETTNG